MSTLLLLLEIIALFIIGQCFVFHLLIVHFNVNYKSPAKTAYLSLLFAITLAYAIMSFTDLTERIIGGDIILRIIDYIGCIFLFLCWLYISTTKKTIIKISIITSITEIITDMLFLCFYMNNDYSIISRMQLCWAILSFIYLFVKICIFLNVFKYKREEGLYNISSIIAAIMFLAFITTGYCEDITISFNILTNSYCYQLLSIISLQSIIILGLAILTDLMINTLFPLISRDYSKVFLQIKEIYCLTDRELDIIQLLYKRFSEKEISEILFISTGTVKTHKRNLYKKLEISNRIGLIELIDNISNTINK